MHEKPVAYTVKITYANLEQHQRTGWMFNLACLTPKSMFTMASIVPGNFHYLWVQGN